jgi:repressor LexA
MQNYNEILEKLKDILSQELDNKKVYDKDIAAALEINYDAFRKQKQNSSTQYLEIMTFLAKRNISINWFFFNQLPESLIENTSNYILIRYQSNINASTGAGAINTYIDSKPLVIDKQLLDHINANYTYTEVIRSVGDSMEPDIPNDSLVFVDKNDTYIKDKNVYLINHEDTLYIKRIRIKDDTYYMCSSNNIYKDIKLDVFEIIGKVKGILSKI